MSTQQTTSGTGGCLCGAVQYEVSGELRPVICCHCEQCRKISGHYIAATACKTESLNLIVEDGLHWYQSSPKARRGHCKVCGSSLFWEPTDGDYTSILAGTLTRPTGLKISHHIHVHMASDYYSIDDGLPQHEEEGYPSYYSEKTT